jgi:hypothetical protein
LWWSAGYEYRYGRVEMLDKAYFRNERKWLIDIPGAEEYNNRRKMAGLPLIRRAKS